MASRADRLPLIDFSTMHAAVDQVAKSKTEATRKYLGNNYTVSSVKPLDLDLSTLFFSTTFNLTSTASDRELKKRNLEVLCGLRSIITSDYPEFESIMQVSLLFPFLSLDSLLMKTIWIEQARDLLIFEKLYINAFSAWAKIKLKKDEVIESAPDGISLKRTETGYDYKLTAPPIYSTRLIAFLGKLFKKKFSAEGTGHQVIKASSSHFLENIDLIQFFCNDSDEALRDFARKLYWLATFEEIESNLKVIRNHAIQVHKKSSRFCMIFGMEKFTKQAQEFVSDYWTVNSILFPPTSASSATKATDFTTLPDESLEAIIAVSEGYLAKEPLKQKAFKTLSKLGKEIKQRQLADEPFTRALKGLECEIGINYDSSFICPMGLDSVVDLSVVHHIPLIDTAEFEARSAILLATPIFLPEPRKAKLVDVTASKSNCLAASSAGEEELAVVEASPGEENVSPTVGGAGAKSKVVAKATLEPIIEIPVAALADFLSEKKEAFYEAVAAHRPKVRLDDIEYAERVENWFSNPAAHLDSEKYASLSKEIQRHVHFIHTFPSIIDQFVGTQYSAFMPWVNKAKKGPKGPDNWLFALPCEAEKGGMTHRGFLVYVIDPVTKECFHRCFDIESEKYPLGTAMMHGWDQIVENFSWSEVDFPDLSTAMARDGAAAKASKAKGGGGSDYHILYERCTDMVTIHVPDGTIYRLFKIL